MTEKQQIQHSLAIQQIQFHDLMEFCAHVHDCKKAGEIIAEMNQRLKIEHRPQFRHLYYECIYLLKLNFERNIDELRESVEHSQKEREDILYHPRVILTQSPLWLRGEWGNGGSDVFSYLDN